jgi:hypothetical protein
LPDESLTPETIATAALDPASATVDGQSATAHSIPDMIAAAKFEAASNALSGDNANGGAKSGWGNRVTRKARARFRGPT